MTKISTNVAGILLTFLFAGLISSCKKETLRSEHGYKIASSSEANKKRVIRDYSDDFVTYYQFIPDLANGWVPPNPGPAWYPGGGEGNASHLGKVSTYYNQYASFSPTGFGSTAAPVNMFFASQLSAIGIDVPDAVSTIVFDKKGNSVWFRLISNTTVPVSQTRINFSGVSDIIGGTGKFAGATGQVKLIGYFNPTDPNDAAVSSVGFITY